MPATDAQLGHLATLGAACSGGLLRGEATALIRALKSRRANEPATPKQRRFLRWQGHERADDPELTKCFARKLIGALKNGQAA